MRDQVEFRLFYCSILPNCDLGHKRRNQMLYMHLSRFDTPVDGLDLLLGVDG